MKTRFLISLIAGLFCYSASAQTADDWVNQGLSSLTAKDLNDANTDFAQALAISPTNENANTLYAITRLLVLPSQPAGSNFLTQIGIPISGRNIYYWTANPPEDTNGVPLAPSGVDANEFTAQLRTNVLNVVVGAIGNLSEITNTNFTINLTSSETSIIAVTVDYGDLKLIQAGLYAAEYFIYTVNSQNVNVQLTSIRSLYTNGNLAAQSVLANYPQLFTFATTNDLQAARIAFTNAANDYVVASAFIRARPTNEMRLFNFDQVSATNEADFRSVLADLENSLAGPQVLTVDTNLTVNFSTQFSGNTTWRSLLPQFQGNAILLGSFPDLTFGGVIDGLTRDEVEGNLSELVTMLPVGSKPIVLSSNSFEIAFTTLKGHYYVLEASTNLLNWQFVTNFTATTATSALIDLQGVALSKRFYRLRDDTGFLSFEGVVLSQSTGLPIAGAEVQSLWDGSTAFTDSNGRFYLSTTLPAEWYYADELEISALGYSTSENYYYSYGNGLVSGLQIYLSPRILQVSTVALSNYTWLFPIVPTWESVELDLTLTGPDNAVLWTHHYSGSGGMPNFTDGYTSSCKSAMTKILNQMVKDFDSQDFL